MFLAFLTMSWLVYNGIHNPHNTQLKCIHPNACNWLSSEATRQKSAAPVAKKAVQSVFLWASFNSGALQSLGAVVLNDETEHKSIEKVAGEVPIPVGEQWRNNTQQGKLQAEGRTLQVGVSQVRLLPEPQSQPVACGLQNPNWMCFGAFGMWPFLFNSLT